MSLHLSHSSFSNPSVALPTPQLIIQPFPLLHLRHRALLIFQPFRYFTYVTTHSPTHPSLYYVTAHFPTLSIASPTSQSSAHSPTFPLLHKRHSSFPKPSVALPTSQFILQPFRRFTYVTAHSPTLSFASPSHSSFSNPSFASPKSQFFTYVTWRAAHAC